MKAMVADGLIRNWAMATIQGHALVADTPRVAILDVILHQMAERVGVGGDPEQLHDDLHAMVFDEMPTQLGVSHPTAVQHLQDHFEELWTMLEDAEKPESEAEPEPQPAPEPPKEPDKPE